MNEISSLIDDLKNFKTRSLARTNLSALGPEKAGKVLLDLVRNGTSSENAVWAAITIFSAWKWRPAAEDLVNLLELRPNLQGDLVKALQAITGAQHGYDPKIWKVEVSGGGVLEKIISLFSDEEVIESNIIKSDEHEDYCVIKLAMSEGRKQKVSVMPMDESFEIYSESGIIAENQVESVQKFALNYPDISIKCEKDSDKFSVTLSRQYSKQNVIFSDFKQAIKNLAEVADYAEMHLTQDDKI